MTLLDTYIYQADTIHRLVRVLDDLSSLYYERVVLTQEEQKSLQNARKMINKVEQALERREGCIFRKLDELVKEEEE